MAAQAAGVFRRTPIERSDQRVAWERTDQAFFAAGACHILAWVCRASYPDRPIEIAGVRPAGEWQVFHVYAVWNGWAFDHSGWNPEPQLLAVNTEFEGRPLERVAIIDDLAVFCATHYSRMPGEYWQDPLPRARAYVSRHNPPWAQRHQLQFNLAISRLNCLRLSFLVGPDGSFGIAMDGWVPLHARVEGWVESLALAHTAQDIAETVTKLSGDAVTDLDLSGMRPVPETAGVVDTWWHGAGSLIAIYAGEAELFGRPDYRVARVYSGNIGLDWLQPFGHAWASMALDAYAGLFGDDLAKVADRVRTRRPRRGIAPRGSTLVDLRPMFAVVRRCPAAWLPACLHVHRFAGAFDDPDHTSQIGYRPTGSLAG